LVQRTMERAANTNIIFLDACRNNPLARNLSRAMGTRSADIGRGLAQVESGTGTLISFSTQPGNVASDGAGRNSPFTGALAKRMATSNDDLSALLIEVRNDVIDATQNRQVPWENSSLRGRFYFNLAARPAPSAGPAPQPSPQPQPSDAAQAWTVAERSTDPAVLEAFIKYYGDTFYGAMARARLARLRGQEVARRRTEKPPPPQPEAACYKKFLPSQAPAGILGGGGGKKPGGPPGFGPGIPLLRGGVRVYPKLGFAFPHRGPRFGK